MKILENKIVEETPSYFEKVFRESFIGKLKAKLSRLGIVEFLRFQQVVSEENQALNANDIMFTEKGMYTIHQCYPFEQDDALALGVSPKDVACRYISSLDKILKNHEWKTERSSFGNGIYQMIFSKKFEDENSADAFMYRSESDKYSDGPLLIKFEITDLSHYVVLPNSSQFKPHGINFAYIREPVYDNVLSLIQKVHPSIQVPENYQAKVHNAKEYDEDDRFIGERDSLLNNLIDNQYKVMGISNTENLPHDMADLDFDSVISKKNYSREESEYKEHENKVNLMRDNIEKVADGIIYYEPRYSGYVVQTFNQDTIKVVGGYLDYSKFISLDEAQKVEK